MCNFAPLVYLMKATTNTSLLNRNRISRLTPDDDFKLADYLEVVKAFSRLTYQSVYVIDYAQMKFEYVSANPLFLSGYSPQEVLEMGYEFYFKNVPESDLKLLTLINETGFDFFEKIPAGEKKGYSINYDFNLIKKDGKPVLINHKLTPLFLTADGKMWKAMCLVSISNNQNAGNAIIDKEGSDEIWKLNIENGIWCKVLKPQLSERELEVLRLYAQGLTINQIADKIFVAPDTVKYYRRRIFESFNASNIVEALSYAVNNKII